MMSVVEPSMLLDAGSLALLAGIFHRMGSLRADVDALRDRLSRLEERFRARHGPHNTHNDD